jgi:hypothetical protein
MNPTTTPFPFLTRRRSAASQPDAFDGPTLARLGEGIAECGLAAFQSEIDALARFARRHGLAPVAAKVLTDPRSPSVARERAFAVVASAVTRVDRDDRADLAAC